MTVRLLQITDLHVLSDPDAHLRGIPTRETLRDVLSLIQSSGDAFDRVVVTGDHTHDEQRETYQAIRELLAPWWDRIHMVPGNHDDRALIREVFGDRVQTTDEWITFSFDEGDWRFVGVDSHIPGEVPGDVDPRQVDWLRNRIDEHGDGPVGVFLHHPPVSVNSVWMDAIALRNPEPLLDLIRSSPQVRFVCCGHVHHEFESRIGDAVFLTTPSTGVQFNPNADKPSYAAEAPGYRVFEIDGDQFRSQVIRLPEVRYVPDPDA